MLAYSGIVLACPKCVILLYSLVIITLTGIGWKPIDISPDLAGFFESDGVLLRNQVALNLASLHRNELDGTHLNLYGTSLRPDEAWLEEDNSTGLSSLNETLFLKKELTIFYTAADGGSLFDERVLRDMRSLESQIRLLQGWQRLCIEDVVEPHRWLCNPGDSFVALAWPTLLDNASTWKRFDIKFDAGGAELLPLNILFGPYGS
jgi:hypothetical protein